MVFLSCRIVFPADTCTVTVLMPSRENVYATLPSRVITGCWGSEREREKKGRGRWGVRLYVLPWETLINGWLTSHTAVIYTTEVSGCWPTDKNTHRHTRTMTHSVAKVCAVLHAAQRPTGSFLCDTSSSLLSLLTSPFVLQIALRC